MLRIPSGAVAALVAAAGGAFVVVAVASCGASNDAGGLAGPSEDASFDAPTLPGRDAAGDAVLPGIDASADSGVDAPAPDGGISPSSTATLAVHASPDLREIRLCIQDPATHAFVTPWAIPDDRPMPESNYAGIPPGGGVVLPALRALDQPGATLTVYAILANKITNDVPPSGLRCGDLICASPSCLTANADYFQLVAQAPPRAFTTSATLLAITGCLPAFLDANASVARCGASYDSGKGNLAIVTGSVEGASLADMGQIGVVPAQLSAGLDGLGSIAATFGALASGADASALALPPYPGVVSGAPFTAEVLYDDDGGAAFDTTGVTLAVTPSDGGAAESLAFSLASITRESDPSQLPGDYLQANRTYLFAVLGDPTSAAAQMSLPDGAPNPAYDGHGLHVIALRATIDAGSLPPPPDAGDAQ